MLSKAAEEKLAALETYLRANASRLTVDGDVHPSDFALLPDAIKQKLADHPDYYHGKPILSDDLIPQMDAAGVDMALCWQNPAVLGDEDTEEGRHQRLLAANEAIAALAEKHPKRIIPGGWTDPKALGVERAIDLARTCVEGLGMPIVKMNPAQNAYPITDPIVSQVLEAIIGLGAVPAFHFGADTPYTPADGLAELAKRFAPGPIIGVHMGGGGAGFVEAEETYRKARAYGLEFPNLFFVLSAKREVHMISDLVTYALAGEPYCRNIAIASDAPYGDMVWHMTGFDTLFRQLAGGNTYGDPRLKANPGLFTPEVIQNFKGRNLADLAADSCARIIRRSRLQATG